MKTRERYQLDNPNNARIFIDYRKEKNKVRFEYVGQTHPFYISLIVLARRIFLLPLVFLFLTLAALGVMGHISCIFYYFVFICIFIGLPLLFTYVKYFKKKLPYLLSFGLKPYIANFEVEDVKNLKVEIPLFSNTFLNYRATGEMSKYLERVEITEHPFNYCLTFKKRTLTKPNEYLWKAQFYFSKQPAFGELLVAFR